MALEEVRIEDIMRDTLGTTNLNDLHSTKYEQGETKMEQLRVIMTLVFDGNPEKNTSGTFNYVNYGSEYFPQIKSFNKYWDITGSIDEVIGLNNALDYKNNNNSKGSTLFKIAYLVTDELYRSVTNDFYFDPRDLSEDISNGRFFDRDLHEELVKAFFNTPEYLHELDITGILDTVVERNIAENTNHLKFVTNDNKRLLLGKDGEADQSDYNTKISYVKYNDIEYSKILCNRYEEYRKELKHFIFDLGKRGLDNDTLQPLINAAGTLKEVNKYLEEANEQFEKLYKERLDKNSNTDFEDPKEGSPCNTRYITETKTIKNENYKEGGWEPEYVTQTRILPNPNYNPDYAEESSKEETDKASKITETVAKLPGTFIEKMNELSEANVLEKLLTPEQKEIVKKNTEAFAKAFEELTTETAKRMQEALKNMEKFNKEHKEDK